jgi:hypothetical protein
MGNPPPLPLKQTANMEMSLETHIARKIPTSCNRQQTWKYMEIGKEQEKAIFHRMKLPLSRTFCSGKEWNKQIRLRPLQSKRREGSVSA